MNDLLLSDILTAEREISQRIAAVEKEAAASLEELKRALEAELAQEADRLQVETARRVEEGHGGRKISGLVSPRRGRVAHPV